MKTVDIIRDLLKDINEASGLNLRLDSFTIEDGTVDVVTLDDPAIRGSCGWWTIDPGILWLSVDGEEWAPTQLADPELKEKVVAQLKKLSGWHQARGLGS